MNNKKGISLTILMLAVAIMLIIITTVTVVGVQTINVANYESHISKLGRMEDLVNLYYLENGNLPISYISVDPESISIDLKNETILNGDESNKLFVVNMSNLNTSTIDIGNGEVKSNDVFVVSENTHNVYYLKGFEYEGKVIYGSVK